VRLSRLTPGLAASTGPPRWTGRRWRPTWLSWRSPSRTAKTRAATSVPSQGFSAPSASTAGARLPAEAELYPSDHPRRAEASAPRAIPEFVMNQLESADNLARLTDPRIGCWSRSSSAPGCAHRRRTRLGLDCLIHDHQGAVYLHYRNHKMRRDAMVPIDDELTP